MTEAYNNILQQKKKSLKIDWNVSANLLIEV